MLYVCVYMCDSVLLYVLLFIYIYTKNLYYAKSNNNLSL
jgi:hypothetical protein